MEQGTNQTAVPDINQAAPFITTLPDGSTVRYEVICDLCNKRTPQTAKTITIPIMTGIGVVDGSVHICADCAPGRAEKFAANGWRATGDPVPWTQPRDVVRNDEPRTFALDELSAYISEECAESDEFERAVQDLETRFPGAVALIASPRRYRIGGKLTKALTVENGKVELHYYYLGSDAA